MLGKATWKLLEQSLLTKEMLHPGSFIELSAITKHLKDVWYGES